MKNTKFVSQQPAQRRHVTVRRRFGSAAARIARKERERVAAERQRMSAHSGVALGNRNMIADINHFITPTDTTKACHATGFRFVKNRFIWI